MKVCKFNDSEECRVLNECLLSCPLNTGDICLDGEHSNDDV